MSEFDNKSGSYLILLLLLALVASIYSVFIQGYVFSHLWNLLLLPVFPDLPQLDISWALGISLVIGWLRRDEPEIDFLKDVSKESKTEARVALGFMKPTLQAAIFLAIGHVFHHFYV